MSGPQHLEKTAEAEEQDSGPGAGLLAPAIDFTSPFGLPRPIQRRNWLLSVSVAALTHFAVLYGLWPQTDDSTGVGGGDLTGIEVEIISAAVLDRRSSTDHTVGTGSDVALYGRTGSASAAADTAASEEAADQRRDPVPEETTPAPQLVADELPSDTPEPEAVTIALAKSPEPQPADSRDEPRSPADTRNAPVASEQAVSQEQASAAGAAAPGLPSAPTVSRGESTSPGIVQKYKQDIIERLASRKPKGIYGLRGEVAIEFTIAGTGEVSHAKVVRSSGQPTLDEAALAAVAGTRFPAPPSGLSAAQLTYRIPYYFR